MSTAFDELRELRQWVAWAYEERNGDVAKVPKNPHTGGNASSTNPETWGTYDQATAYATRAQLAGVGFVFAATDPYCGIDLDNCLEDSGFVAPWAAELVAALDTYCEISPSGHGLKLWGRGKLPGNGLNTGSIELYDHGRYFTFTGHRYGARLEIRDCQAAVMALYHSLKPRERAKSAAPPSPGERYAPYAAAALDRELDAVARAAEGQRNDQLNRSSFALGQLVAGGALDRTDVEALLEATASAIGLAEREARATIKSGLNAGAHEPRGVPLPAWEPSPPPAVNGNGYHALEAIALARETEAEERLRPADSLVLDLPASARLPETLGADVGEWLDDYTRYASLVSERTPAIVHEAAGLWLASVAVARRLYVPMPHGDVFPNLYALAVAPTTLYAKTTGLNVMTTLLDDALPHLTLSNESTPEALLSELAGKEPPNLTGAEITDKERELWRLGQRFAAQRGLVLEEASSLLAGLRKEYMQGMAELLLRLYDCPNSYRRHTRGGGYMVIRQAYMSIVGWTTPARLRTAETNTAWHDGLFARFALLTPEGAPLRPSAELGSRPARPTRLVEDLTRLANVLLAMPEHYPEPVIARAVAIDEAAAKAWRQYYLSCSFDLLTARNAPDGRLHGTYGRLPAMALKVASILAALDWAAVGTGDPVITLGHYAHAQRIAEKWRASSHRLLDLLTARTEAEEENADLERVLKVLEQMGASWLTVRDLVRKLDSNRYTTSQVHGLVKILEQDGRVEVQERRPEGGKGGRPSMVVRFCQAKTG
jgi:hypothetical protein